VHISTESILQRYGGIPARTGKHCREKAHEDITKKVKKLKHLHPFRILFFCIEGMFSFDIMAGLASKIRGNREFGRVAVFAQSAG
jgi:hypothetical protein